jgi:hypothetical protein
LPLLECAAGEAELGDRRVFRHACVSCGPVGGLISRSAARERDAQDSGYEGARHLARFVWRITRVNERIFNGFRIAPEARRAARLWLAVYFVSSST